MVEKATEGFRTLLVFSALLIVQYICAALTIVRMLHNFAGKTKLLMKDSDIKCLGIGMGAAWLWWRPQPEGLSLRVNPRPK
jgi:hypothetical protein